MNKYIILTSISEPTVATIKYCEIADQKDWKLIFVGDLKTPHTSYQELEKKYKNFMYMTPEQQEKLYPELSQLIIMNILQLMLLTQFHQQNIMNYGIEDILLNLYL